MEKKVLQFRIFFACCRYPYGPRFDPIENYSAGNFTVALNERFASTMDQV